VKKITRWFKDIFRPEEFNNMDTDLIRASFHDVSVRNIWLSGCFDELRRINMEVDQRLLTGTNLQLTDLCARRKAYQDILEAILSARRQVQKNTQSDRHNPKVESSFVNLDRVAF
jgi:hypothetical protein